MPTYVYECKKCQKVFEVDQRVIEDPLKDCDCGGNGTLKRLIQPIAVMFKGGGFHINDYASSPPPAEEPSSPLPAAPEPSPPASPSSDSTKPTTPKNEPKVSE